MKYLLGATVLLTLVATGPAWADNVWNCQDVGVPTVDPVGDAEGHVVQWSNFSCRVDAGTLKGGIMNGTIVWDVNKGVGTLISGSGVVRKPGSLAIYNNGEGTLNLSMNDKGQPTGFTAKGTATWVEATGDAAAMKGKTRNWVAKAIGPGTFSVEDEAK